MARLKDLAESTRDSFMFDPRLIEIEEGFNPRDFTSTLMVERLQHMAASIEQNGVKVPLTVVWRNDRVILRDGETRLRAVRMLLDRGVEVKAVPCQAEDRHANEEDQIASLILRNDGQQLSMLEQATVYKRLLALGLNESDAARKCGVSASHVNQCLTLYSAPIEVREMVKQGEVSASLAVRTVRREKEEAAPVLREAVKRAKDEGKKKATAATLSAPRAALPKPLPYTLLQVADMVDTLKWIADNEGDTKAGNMAAKCLAKIGVRVNFGEPAMAE